MYSYMFVYFLMNKCDKRGYIAPELSDGTEYMNVLFYNFFFYQSSYSIKSDIYAVGCTLYYMITGINIYY
jgi:serine/threonine protein kinase